MAIYDFSSLRIRTVLLLSNPDEVLFEEATEPPRERAHVVCVWISRTLATECAETFERLAIWIDDFHACITRRRDERNEPPYIPRLAVVTPTIPNDLHDQLKAQRIQVVIAEEITNGSEAAKALRRVLTAAYADFCNPDRPMPEGFGPYFKQKLTPDEIKKIMDGPSIEDVIAEQYPEGERDAARAAVQQLLDPYKTWTETIQTEPFDIS